MSLPFAPPLKPMLAKAELDVPRGPEWRYEPKWDGFRALVFRDGDDVHIGSRGERPLHRYFPELVEVLRKRLPDGVVTDGEIVVPVEGRIAFDSLQLRIHPAESRIRMLGEEIPASYVVFDLLAEGGRDLRGETLAARWAALKKVLKGTKKGTTLGDVLKRGPAVLLTPLSTDADQAERWVAELEQAGLDGVIAKREDQPYRPGKREWVKVKRKMTADCVVAGYRLSKAGDGVGSLLLGLYQPDGALRFVGFTSSFKAKERREVLAIVKPYEGGSGFDMGPGGISRWQQEEHEYVSLDPVLVVEVAYDHITAGRFRHGSTFIRWRDDKKPEECTTAQMI
jgi:ATP-dependent DNA ligase